MKLFGRSLCVMTLLAAGVWPAHAAAYNIWLGAWYTPVTGGHWDNIGCRLVTGYNLDSAVKNLGKQVKLGINGYARINDGPLDGVIISFEEGSEAFAWFDQGECKMKRGAWKLQ